MSLDRGQRRSHGLGLEVRPAAERGDQETAQHVRGGVDVLGGVQRVRHRDALPPPLGLVGDGAHQQDVARGLRAEGGAERCEERQPDAPQFDSHELHDAAPLSTTYQPVRSKPVIRPPSASNPVRVPRTPPRHSLAKPGSVRRSDSTSGGRATSATRPAPEPGTGPPSSDVPSRTPAPSRRKASASTGCASPALAATTVGARSGQFTSNRSLSSPPLMLSFMPP